MAHTITEDHRNHKTLEALLMERILVVDGAMGTALERLGPSVDDFGGEPFHGCNEMLNLHASDMVRTVHRGYIEAGADFIKTNSFNGSPIVMEEYGVTEMSRELARRAAELAVESVQRFSQGRSVFVMGSMGPGTRSITVTGGVTFDEIYDAYRVYATGLLEGGADLLLLETMQDTLNVKAALLGIQAAQNDLGRDAPMALSVTIETGGTMLAGQNIEALYHTVRHFHLFSIGLNCATGPAMMSDHLRTLAGLSRFPVSVWPNAGLPDHNGNYNEEPDVFHKIIGNFARKGWINLAGGCCGTTPDHIRAICDAVEGIEPRKPRSHGRYQDDPVQPDDQAQPALAGSEAMVVMDDNRPVFIGERTNTIGSRRFKRLISQGNWDVAAEIGRKQVRKGAMVLDLCVANPDRDEVPDFINVLRPLLRKVRVPIMIDTTDPNVVEAALKNIGGKPAINSVNLEDGGKRMREIATMAKRYGASLICGLIDDDPERGMAVTIDRKLEVAAKIYRILKEEFHFPDGDIIFDPLVFPAATGDPHYIGAARATVKATQLIKEKYPQCLTVLGISNVSFGLPPAGREVVNSVFLYLCTRAGLDMAIVNTQKLRRYPTIPDEDRTTAEKLLMQGDNETISEFTARYRDVDVQAGADDWADLTVEEKVTRAVVEANREGLEENLEELLRRMGPFDIINGVLMTGMDEVGRLFGDNRLIVAEVLESAEVMKKAVDYLRPHFPPDAGRQMKGKMILATVKGDVHDIGKNLVDMILSNNGFDVINLGIKVPPERIIEAVREHQPDMIGLSGLLVRSAQQMIATAEDLTASGVDLPMIVGGAALTSKYVTTRIAPVYRGPVYYAPDVMNGLSLCNRIVTATIEPTESAVETNFVTPAKAGVQQPISVPTTPAVGGWIETDVPQPPDLDEHILTDIPVDLVFPYVNLQMLYGKHLGVKSSRKRMNDPDDAKMIKLKAQVERMLQSDSAEGILRPQAIYRWFRAMPDGEYIVLESSEGKESILFHFPRRNSRGGISAADWIRPDDRGGDYVALFVVTSAADTSVRAAELRDEGRLLDSLILQATAIQLAEATAEWLHQYIRIEWGIGDPPGMTLSDLFHKKYRGVRLSFGYPSCPDLEDQKLLFDLLKPERIGVSLTEGLMMEPEGSVSAVVFHHPEGKY